MYKQCLFFFGGKEADGGGSMTFQAGAAPSMCTLNFRLSYSYQQIADLLLTDGTESITFKNCRLTRATITQGNGGARWRQLQILDRRWAWSSDYGGVYGAYNLNTRAAGDPRNRKSAIELAALLCQAMGETGYDVSVMPNTVYPRVDWTGENPATELEELARAYGCFITLSTSDKLILRKDGIGQSPTNDPRQSDFTYSEELPVIPKALLFEGDSILCQHDWKLIPVGLETATAKKGQFLPIDQLSYKPSGGWAKETPGDDEKGFSSVIDAQDRAAARAYIWKAYRISGPVQLPVPSDNFLPRNTSGKVDGNVTKAVRADFKIDAGDEWRILPLEQEQLQFAKDAETNDTLKPQVIGYFAKGVSTNNATNPLPPEATNYDAPIADVPVPKAKSALIYSKPFTVDFDRGYVFFQDHVYLVGFTGNALDNDTYLPAKIRLRCAFPIRAKANAARMISQYVTTPGSPVAVSIVKKLRNAELGYEYGLGTANDTSTKKSNEPEFFALADAMLQQETQKYSIGRGYSSPWKGLIFDKQIDGIVRTVSWDVSQEGEGITSIDYNMERPERYASLDDLRLMRRQTALAVQARMLAQQNLRRNKKQ